MIRAVTFDAGLTLLYPHPSVYATYAAETAKFGAAASEEEFARVFIPVYRTFVKEYAATESSSDELDHAMWREILRRVHGRIPALSAVPFEPWFEHLYLRFGDPHLWRLYPDAAPALAELRRRGYRLAVVSNWDRRLRPIAEGLGLTRLVDAFVVSSEAGVRKPHRRIFERTLAEVGVRPEEAVHVGDVPDEDVEGARAAGMGAVLMQREKRITEGTVPGVPVVRSLGELVDWLDRERRP
ncbi:MAG: HAD-IA family hydrolase [Planctomycetes bacterium]|nr:HAD-IA family hydrolase [Planctomycetota bacterium]